ncbi:MAG: PEP-CTERM system TPR-repeat protein PrsT [Thiohalocapsa sp. PB-PSB1]|nr:MAG: PEP-CTERM system TPR-repeat protein PrsT [Thiohalocapsa sp. PB-PSB1]
MQAITILLFRQPKSAVLLIVLLVSTAVFADAQRLEKATRLFDAGNYSTAEIELKNLLRDDPGLVDARLLLGQLYLKTQQGSAAEKELLRAKDLGAPPERWRIDLVDAYLQQREFRRALEELDVDSFPEELKGRAFALRGRAFLGLEQTDEAKLAFTKAVNRDPSDKFAAAGLIQLALLAGDMDAAAETSVTLVEQHPADPEVLLLRAEVLRRMDDTAAAIEQFGAVLALEPENLRALLGRATALIRLQEFDRARADLESVDELRPNVVIVSYLRGVMAFYDRDWQQAGEQLQRVLRVQPNHMQSQMLLGIVSYARNELQIAEEYLSGVVAAMPGNLQAAKVLAATRLKLREAKGAVEVLQPLAANGNDPQVMALLGSAYMLSGDPERGQEWLNLAVETAPDVAALRTQLALTLIAGGKTGEAITELESAVDLGQEVLQADVLLVLAQLKEKNYDEAVTASIALETRQPDSPIAYNLTGLALLAQGKLPEARARFERALEVDSSFITALINMARVDVAEQNMQAAAQRYQQVLKQDPRNLAAMLGMAALSELQDDDTALLKWLNKAQDANAAANQPGLLLVRFHIDRNQYQKALNVASTLATRFPDNVDVLEILGRAQTLAGEEASAIRTFDQILERNPDDPRIYYLRGGAQWKTKNYTGAAASFRRAIDLRPDFLDARVALASMLLAEKNYSGVLSVAWKIQQDYPDQDLGFRIEGRTQIAARRPEAAIEPLKQALEINANPDTVRQLAEAYADAGQPEQAISSLEQWVEQTPDDLLSQAHLGMLLHGQGKPDRALPIYERIYNSGQANLLVLNNLAWLLHERNDPRALEIARKAYELNPNRPEVADTFGWILFNNGDRNRGLSILQEAHLAYPTQTEIAYHTAVALDAMERSDEALEVLRRLLREHPNSDQAPAAQTLYNKLTANGAG